MIKVNIKWFIASILMYIVNAYRYGLKTSLIITTVVLGLVYYMVSIFILYLKFWNAHFNFKKAITKKEWLWFFLINMTIWGLFIMILPEKIIDYAVLFSHFSLIFLIILDILVRLFKRFF